MTVWAMKSAAPDLNAAIKRLLIKGFCCAKRTYKFLLAPLAAASELLVDDFLLPALTLSNTQSTTAVALEATLVQAGYKLLLLLLLLPKRSWEAIEDLRATILEAADWPLLFLEILTTTGLMGMAIRGGAKA